MLGKLRGWRRGFWDVRDGELGRTVFMALYLLFILLAYYILKPVSRALFLNKFDMDKVPLLYMLLAPAGGALAYLYSRLAVKASLTTAVNAATVFAAGMNVLMGYLLYTKWDWVFYAFNVWVSMFSILMVTQGWVIASNVFSTREAKRLYGILGLGAVIGAFLGGTYTRQAVKLLGENNLILTSAAFTVLAYLMYRGVLRQPGVDLSRASALQEGEEASFSLRDIGHDIRRHRHLQVIVGIVVLTFIVDVTIEYQFSAFAKARYQGQELTAFMGSFQGVYLNLVNFVFQFFLTAAVVRWVGVGGVLQIMPVTISIASLGIYFAPGVLSTSIARLMEAATRYTFNRTGMELLYLPLPLELRNRTKAFLDIFVDRFGRGLGGVLLYVLTVTLGISPQGLSIVVLVFTGSWIYLSWRAQREYLASVERRLASRQLDVTSVREAAADPAMIGVLEKAALSGSARQASYALDLLGSVDGYDVRPLVGKLAGSPHAEVRAAVYKLARRERDAAYLPEALAEIRSSRAGDQSAAVRAAVSYATHVSPDGPQLCLRLLRHPSGIVSDTALDCVLTYSSEARQYLTIEWVREAAKSARLFGDAPDLIPALLADQDASVVTAALESAGQLRRRANVELIVPRLGDARVRGAAIASLAAHGPMIAGTLRDHLDDPDVARSIRLRIPRVLAAMEDQKAADELMASVSIAELELRGAVLNALSKLRLRASHLEFGPSLIDKQILDEAKLYYSLAAALEPFRGWNGARGAVRLLASTLEGRLKATLQRLFALLGLKYEPVRMRSAWQALQRSSSEDHAAAIEFLDTVLDRELKRFMMPLFDDIGRLGERGRDLFGIEKRDAEAALRELLRSGDSWLVACAIAAAAELRLHSLKTEIVALRSAAGEEVARVAERSLPAFAS